MPTSSLIVMHKVKDFAAWKPVFEADEPNRKAAGITGHVIMLDTAKPNMVGLWLPTNDLAKAEAFAASPELKAKMKEAGVIGKPTVTPLNTVSMSPPNATGTMPKFGVMLDTKVKDFAVWKASFDSHDQTRKDAGMLGYAVSQDPKDPNRVTVWLEADDKDKITAFLASPDLAAKMKEGGVKGKPKATIVETGEMKMYQ
jgi:quinol monooxygenase YgiN